MLPIDKPPNEAGQQLVCRELDYLYRFCFRILGNHEDAKDAAQTSAMKAIAAAERAPLNPQEIRPWLTTIARNSCYDMVRKTHLEYYVDPELGREGEESHSLFSILADPSPSSEQRLAWKQLLVAAFKKLNPIERLVLVEVYINGKSQTEVGKEMGIRWIHAIVNRARLKVMDVIRDLAKGGDHNAESLLAAFQPEGGRTRE